jgi:glycosyltransferase involved in cell wall biosynthesis
MMMPWAHDKMRAKHLAGIPVLAAESPVAVERTREYLRAFGGHKTNVVCVPHPVDEKDLQTDTPVERGNRIIAVGRWETWQKNFPLLLETLGRFLAAHPGWSAEVIGKLPGDAAAQMGKLPGDAAARITLAGPVEHRLLARHYRASKIFLMSSRHESFNIAAAEALCCGCAVVGPSQIASVVFFTGRKSGTAAGEYSAAGLLGALETEAAAWADGGRDPDAIAAEWINTTGSEAVTRKMLEVLEAQ